jgi:hypothetical protein
MIALSLDMTESAALGYLTSEMDSLPLSGWSKVRKINADHMFRQVKVKVT